MTGAKDWTKWTKRALLEAEKRELAELFDPETGEPRPAEHHRLLEEFVSPFSAKVRTYLNFKHIPYRRIRVDFELYLHKMRSIVGFPIIPVILSADGRVMQDSTPIIRHFETVYTEPEHPSVIPEDPRLAFLDVLLEDFADEYMPRLIMHTRWGTKHSCDTISYRIARRLAWTQPEADLEQYAAMVLARQRAFDRHLGITDAVREDLDAQVHELIELVEARLAEHRFLLGDRPCVADFALAGHFFAHFWMDPHSVRALEVHGRRTCEWIDTIREFGDVRGQVGRERKLGPWLDPNEVPASLVQLLRFVAQTHLPNALATAKASVARRKRYSVEIRGHECEWSTHHYRAWSFEQVQRALEELDGDDRAWADGLLEEAGLLPAMMAEGIRANGLYEGLTPPFVVDGIGDNRVAHRRGKAEGE